MENLIPQTGFIAFFDILGYQVFLENNSPEQAASRIVETLLKLETDVPNELVQTLGTAPPELHEVIQQMKWLVFSDTILLTLNMGAVQERSKEGAWLCFIGHCCLIWQRMFDYGLPVRGVINCGQFIVQQQCFAGKPIVDAYKLVTQLNFAGCVLTREAKLWSNKLREAKNKVDYVSYTYAIPLNSGEFIEGDILNVASFPSRAASFRTDDIRQAVHEAFWKHEKTVTGTVITKIENTETYLRFLKMKAPDLFIVRPN